MTTLKTIRKFRCPFGICIVLSILIVLSCDFFCRVGIISFSEFRSRVEVAPHHHGDNHDSHHHGKQTAGHIHKHKSKNPESSSKGCCDDRTQQFYSSLGNPSIAHTDLVRVNDFHQIFVFTQNIIVNSYFQKRLLFSSKYDHQPTGPPVSGNIIRVFVSSFLI